MKKLAKELPLEILVAEDNLINQRLMMDILSLFGYKADSSNDGFEVLKAVKKKRYDLILMDIQMPGMSGEETMHKVKELLKKETPKIIAVTAYAMQEDRNRFLEKGMDGYLSKPFRIEELKNEIVSVMKG